MIPTQKDYDILEELHGLWNHAECEARIWGDKKCKVRKYNGWYLDHDVDWETILHEWKDKLDHVIWEIENTCNLCFEVGFIHNHHVSYFPEHIERICDSCHASLNRNMFEGSWIQYTKLEYKKFYIKIIKPAKPVPVPKIQRGRIYSSYQEDPRHAMTVSSKGYYY